MIVINEASDKWLELAASYVENPTDKNQDSIKEALDIASNHQVDSYIAAILKNSKI